MNADSSIIFKNYTKIKIRLIFLIIVVISTSIFSQNEINIASGENNIHLKTFGKGKPILIINGGPGLNSEGFEQLAKILGKSNKTIIYDQRGTGKSKLNKINKNTITLDLMIEDIETIRKHLKIEKWVVLGHSFGGMLASYYVSKFPDRTKGLILSSSGGIDMELFSDINISSKLTFKEVRSLNYWNTKIAAGDTTYHAKFMRGKYLAPAYLYNKSHVNTIAHRLTQVNYFINNLVVQNMYKIGFDCKEGLKKFSSPVLIIQGGQDIISRKVAENAHAIFQKSELVILKECGHYGWLDQPILYFMNVRNFLNSL